MLKKQCKPPVPPKGNQYALGKGRRPEVSDEDVILLGEELFTWMKEIDEKKIKVVHLSEWYSYIKHIDPKEWDNLIKRACFLRYYNRAIRWMGNKMIKNKDFPQAYGSRFLGIYFKDVREHEKEISREKLDLEKEKIDYEYEKKSQTDMRLQTPPSQDIITSDDENIRLKYENIKLLERIKAMELDADK